MINKKALISDIAGLSQPLTKLVETVARGAGILYEPIHKKRMAKATAEEIKIIADACQNNLQLPVNYEKDGLSISTNKQVRELAQRAMLRNLAQEMNKQQNIESVIDYAKEALKEEKKVSKIPVNQTWLSNFFESAGHVEEDDLQKIWGKLLAGEIKQPNSYSLRTLHILKNMSKKEALLFKETCKLVMRYNALYFIPSREDIVKKYEIHYPDISLLEQCGLISAPTFLTVHYTVTPNLPATIFNKNLAGLLQTDVATPAQRNDTIYSLTASGIELFKIINVKSNNNFLIEYVKSLENKTGHIFVNIYRIKKREGNDKKGVLVLDKNHPIY